MAIKIYIDQGHNPQNPNAGAEGSGFREQDLTYEIGRLTADLLNTGTMTAVDADAIGAVNLGTVPAGTFTVVLIPATSKLIAKKDDGFGGKVNFDLNNGVAGSGANGASVFIGVLEYRVYGEFNLVSGETIVYID